MSDFAQKRDVADPRTVAAFARIVENPERLRLLLVLTVADIRAVGPGVWNGWKGQLMRELYGATEAVFRGGADCRRRRARVGAGWRRTADDARTALVAADPEARAWATAMEDAYFTAFAADEHAAHAALARAPADSGGAAAEAGDPRRPQRRRGAVAAKDRRACSPTWPRPSPASAPTSSARGSTPPPRRGARRLLRAGRAGRSRSARDSPRTLERLVEALEAAAPAATAGAGAAPGDRSRPRRGLRHHPGGQHRQRRLGRRHRDRGLRPRPAGPAGARSPRILAEAGLSIQSAHIDNYGERAVDAFYCYGPAGRQAYRRAAHQRLRAALIGVLGSPTTPSSSAGRPRLERARASVAR